MEVKIISRECVVPSLPTPPHLKTFKLSFLDQFLTPEYVPVVIFFLIDNHVAIQNHDHENEERLRHLKQSLSQTLSRFYPLAGKIIDNLSIDCNDEGVYYAESQVEVSLVKFLSQPDNNLIKKFLPHTPSWNESIAGAHVALVQVNVFDCGGIAIGIYINHMVTDGIGLSAFLKCWSDIARGSLGQNPDYITAPSLFPQNEAFPKELYARAICSPFYKFGKAVTKRFVFDSSAISTLKVKTTNTLVENPTKVEVVSALIWKCAMMTFRENSGIQRPSLLTQAVNLRRRTKLPFSDSTMGNIIFFAISQCQAKTEVETELNQLVCEIKEAKTKVMQGDFLKTLVGEEGFGNFCETLKEINDVFSYAGLSSNGADYIGFTSWIRFGLYDIDFGWGNPKWVTSTSLSNEDGSPMLNYVLLNDTKCGSGVEAWVTLDEHDMAIFQCNEQLLTFSSFDSSPLHVDLDSNAY